MNETASPPAPATSRIARLDDLRIDRGEERQRGGRLWLWLLLAAVAVALGAWWLLRPRPPVVKTAAAVEVASAAGGATTVLNASGYVTARRQATVSSKVTGKVIEVLVEEGMKVKEGQVLAKLDSSNVSASLSSDFHSRSGPVSARRISGESPFTTPR